MRLRAGRIAGLSAICAVAACALPAAAGAAVDRFVDNETGLDDGDCSSQASPCLSFGYAMSQAGTGDTIKVDDSPSAYATSTNLDFGVSVTGGNFVGSDEGDSIIDGGGTFALRVPSGASAGTISGLTIRSTGTALRIQASTTAVSGNTFDSGGANQVDLEVQSGSPLISQNSFTDASTALFDTAIVVDGSSPTISGNVFSNQNIGILAGNGSPANGMTITGNTITGTHNSGSSNGYGIEITGGTGIAIQGNLISGPDSTSSTTGINMAALGLTNQTSGTFRRNQIYGQDFGMFIADTSVATMNGDVIGGSTDTGLVNLDDSNPTGNGAVSAKNLTIVGNSPTLEAQPIGTSLTLDSSIIGDAGIVPVATGSCTITRSRGPSTVVANGCGNFATNAAPDFVNAVGNNFRLTGSASNLANLIDAGDPAAPAGLDTVDFEGQKRNLDGDGNCSEIRDIGADEFLPAGPTATISSGPGNGSTITTANASFTFTSSYPCPGAGFECKLDGGAFSACTSPADLNGLSEGSHTFQVHALDLFSQSGVPDSRTFTVDLPDPPPAAGGGGGAAAPPAPKKCKKAKKRAVSSKKKCKKRK